MGLRGLDPALFDRPKRGFVMPFERWIRQRLGGEMSQLMQDERAAASVGLRGQVLKQLWEAYQAARGDVLVARVGTVCVDALVSASWGLFVSRRYCVITPCRDEADTARRTLDSVTQQTAPPDLWVIVDDGSSDATPAILAEYEKRFDYIRVVRREDRGERSVGPGVVDAFYAGLETVDLEQFDYVCKLDLDLALPPRYFETLMERMEANPRLGTCSGKPYYAGPRNPHRSFEGQLISEACGDEMSVGMAKFYRVSCFQEIGGFVRAVMWDGMDCHRCRMMGWIACSWDDPELRFIHLRPMGSSYKGILTGRMRHGYGQYYMGTGLLYMTVSAMYRMMCRPHVIGGMAMWWGYVRAWLTHQSRQPDGQLLRFIQQYQWACLLHGKRAATKVFDERYASNWQAPQMTRRCFLQTVSSARSKRTRPRL